MEEKQDRLKKAFSGRTWTRPEPGGKGDGAESGQCFGMERGNRFVRRFRLLMRGGITISVPYAHLPIVIHDPDRDLRIRTGELEVTIKGRGLDILAEALNDEKVLWIRESPSGTDTGGEGTFVSAIDIDGDLLD